MPSYAQILLSEFTDRDDELAVFVRLLGDPARKLLCIWGEGNLGKTTLLARMADYAEQRGITTINVTWQEVSYGYIDVMRRIRDGLGSARQSHFRPFNDLVNFFTKPGYELLIRIDGTVDARVLDRSRIEGSSIGDIAGIIIKDLNLPQPRDDRDTPKEERMVRLTDSFISCLAQATMGSPVVIFLDSLEKATEDTGGWLRGQIQPALRDGKLDGVKIVTASRAEPSLDRSWRLCAEIRRLSPFNLENILLYLDRRGVQKSDQTVLAQALEMFTHGNTGELANLVDSWLLKQGAQTAR